MTNGAQAHAEPLDERRAEPPDGRSPSLSALAALRDTAMSQRVIVGGYRDDHRAGRRPGFPSRSREPVDVGSRLRAIGHDLDNRERDAVADPAGTDRVATPEGVAHARELMQLWGRAASAWRAGETDVAEEAQRLVRRAERLLATYYPAAYDMLRAQLAEVIDDLNDPVLLARGLPRLLAPLDEPAAGAGELALLGGLRELRELREQRDVPRRADALAPGAAAPLRVVADRLSPAGEGRAPGRRP